jgi:hypothetical protein
MRLFSAAPLNPPRSGRVFHAVRLWIGRALS